MNIGVFCSANDLDDKYMAPAREFARLLAASGHDLVYGGSDYGMMKLMADTVQQAGRPVTGVTTEFYRKYASKRADKMIMTKTLGERRAVMLDQSDVIVLLVGGLGTLDEASEVLELKKQSQHNKPVLALNTDGFYDHFQAFLQHMAEEGFLPSVEQEGITIKKLDQYIRFARTPKELMALIDTRPGARRASV